MQSYTFDVQRNENIACGSNAGGPILGQLIERVWKYCPPHLLLVGAQSNKAK
jgi:hypothetical protein